MEFGQPLMNPPDQIDDETLEKMESSIEHLLAETPAEESPSVIPQVLSRASQDTLLLDTAGLVTSKMWACLAALLTPIFALLAKSMLQPGEHTEPKDND